jgi:tungstate transport system substrate-binding protein
MLTLVPLLSGCERPPSLSGMLTLATTTSTQDSGLLDVLVPLFRRQTGIEVRVVAVGSGQALQLGRRGSPT